MIILLIGLSLALAAWIVAGLAIYWVGIHTPAPGSRRLVRTCERSFGFRGKPVPVSLWPCAKDLPPRQTDPSPFRLVLVIDHSASMGSGPGSDLEQAKRAAGSFARGVVSSSCQIGVVAFDQDGQVLCPLSPDRAQVTGAITAIDPGGATDIACGLRTVGQLMAHTAAPPPGCCQVVVLLSDGGSAKTPAVEEAQRLKERGARIVSIALGSHADISLMKAVASSEHDLLTAQEATDLRRLYGIVQGSLEQVQAVDIELRERVTKDALIVSSADELPAYFDFNSREMRWCLPSVARTPREMSYEVIPVRCGWHRVADGAATISMLAEDGQRYEGESNRSPRLLVVPRVGWPVWLVLLNPIFWIIRDALSGRPAPVEIGYPEVPPVEPLPEASPVMAPPVRRATVEPSRTLLIGLGHTGTMVIRALRHLMAQLAINPEDRVQMLAVDTGSQPEAHEHEMAFGADLDSEEAVLMPESVSSLFQLRDDRQAHLAWLDVERELQTLRVADLDLRHGTYRRRVLGRAAVYRHLAEPDNRLVRSIDKRLQELDSGYRVVVVANSSGGSGGGMLADLLVLVRKRLSLLGHDPCVIDALLLSHRVLPDRATPDPERLRNDRALLTELSRFLLRRTMQQPFPQTAGEQGDAPVSQFISSLLLLEQPLELGSESGWLAGVCYSAAGFLLDMMINSNGVARLLDETRRQRDQLAAATGQAMAAGVGSSSRWMPVGSIRSFLTARALLDFVAGDLLLLRFGNDRFRREQGAEEAGAAHAAAEVLLSGTLTRDLPAFLASLPLLAERQSATAEASRLLAELAAYPGAAGLSIDLDADELASAVLANQQRLLNAVLEEWMGLVLNGGRDEFGHFDPENRRGGFTRLTAATDLLGVLSRQALDALREMTVPEGASGYEHRLIFLRHLFSRYHQSIGALGLHLQHWWRLLGPLDDEGNTLVGRLEVDVVQGKQRLDALARQLSPCVVWDDNVGHKLEERYLPILRQQLPVKVLWQPDGASTAAPRLSLVVQGVERRVFGCGDSSVSELLQSLQRLVFDLTLYGVDDLRVSEHMDLISWMRSDVRRQPVDLDQERQAALGGQSAERYELALLPDGFSAGGAAAIMSGIEEQQCSISSRASLARVMTPLALFSSATAIAYERLIDDEPHEKLPLLHQVDRDVAEHEDLFPSFGLTRPTICPALRRFFLHRELLRAVLLAAALGILRRRLDSSGSNDALFIENMQLTPDGNGLQLLLQALDHLSGPGAVHADSVVRIAHERLADMSDSKLLRLLKDCEETMLPVLSDCPPGIRNELISLARLFLEIERARRARSGGGR